MKACVWAIVVFFLILANFSFAESMNVELPDNNSLSSRTGSFVLGEIRGAGQGLFMIDTLSGRLWKLSESQEKEGHYVLTPVLYKYGEETFSYLPMDTGRPDSATSVYRETGE